MIWITNIVAAGKNVTIMIRYFEKEVFRIMRKESFTKMRIMNIPTMR